MREYKKAGHQMMAGVTGDSKKVSIYLRSFNQCSYCALEMRLPLLDAYRKSLASGGYALASSLVMYFLPFASCSNDGGDEAG